MRWSSGSVRRAARALALVALAAPAGADMAYVTCQSGDALSVIDLVALTEVARWPLPGKPAGVAVAGGAVYTVAADTKTVRRHAPSGALLAETVLDGGPIGIAVDAARGRVFVSDWYEARVRVLDAATLAPLTDLATGAAPAGLDLSPDGRLLAAAERDADRVSVFDATTLAPLWRAPVGTRPFGLRFAPDGRLFVANVGSDDMTVLGAETGAPLATIRVGARPYGVGFAAGRAFVTNQYAETVSVIALDTLSPVATLDVGEYPEGVDSTGEGHIAVANWFSNTLSVIDGQTLETLAAIETCDGPRAFGAFIARDQ
ncbi:MAG: hypothetical protein CVT70_01095 [Alphaproteobacteria bacterium HGW-Alphaproteobacteria-1]|nr:MAG: hypothetical protein CVT70_01095 [Alphaproteobacteria bacterium HGW-Alphaproteobacteria-1]